MDIDRRNAAVFMLPCACAVRAVVNVVALKAVAP